MSEIIQSCSLRKATSYQNTDVIHRFMTLYDVSFDEANDIFLNTKKWLWLIAQSEFIGMSITDPLFVIDEMWHNFVLFTVDYTHYCLDCFGRYLHHAPMKQSQKIARQRKLKADPAQVREQESDQLNQQCLLICKKLGADTLLKWYVEYPEKYNEDFFNHYRHKISLRWMPSAELKKLANYVKTGQVRISKSS